MLRDMENSSSSSDENEGHGGETAGLGSGEGGYRTRRKGTWREYWRTPSSQGTNRSPVSMKMGMNRTPQSIGKGTPVMRVRLG